MLVLTAENMKAAEESAVNNGCNYYDLMKSAGNGCADIISKEDKNNEAMQKNWETRLISPSLLTTRIWNCSHITWTHHWTNTTIM